MKLLQALPFDVRDGYPYGTAVATGTETGVSASIGAEGRPRRLTDEATDVAVGNLTPEVDAMFTRPRAALPAPRPSAAKRA